MTVGKARQLYPDLLAEPSYLPAQAMNANASIQTNSSGRMTVTIIYTNSSFEITVSCSNIDWNGSISNPYSHHPTFVNGIKAEFQGANSLSNLNTVVWQNAPGRFLRITSNLDELELLKTAESIHWISKK